MLLHPPSLRTARLLQQQLLLQHKSLQLLHSPQHLGQCQWAGLWRQVQAGSEGVPCRVVRQILRERRAPSVCPLQIGTTTPDVCMEFLLEKLKLLDYEREFCRKK
jgi:hypothetical protein